MTIALEVNNNPSCSTPVPPRLGILGFSRSLSLDQSGDLLDASLGTFLLANWLVMLSRCQVGGPRRKFEPEVLTALTPPTPEAQTKEPPKAGFCLSP